MIQRHTLGFKLGWFVILAVLAVSVNDSAASDPPPTAKRASKTASCDGKKLFYNGQWLIERLDARIPEGPFAVRVDGNDCGSTRVLTFAHRLEKTSRHPQVFVINSSGYLRIKAGADPKPALPFGQSLVLGPAIYGTALPLFPISMLFLNPQLQTVEIDTSRLHADGTGSLSIKLSAGHGGLPAGSNKSNQIMDLIWDITLHKPTPAQTEVDIAGRFTFTKDFALDSRRTAEFQSFRLFTISSMYVDPARHDVDALRYRDANGLVELVYVADLAGMPLPEKPTALNPNSPVFDSIHTDDVGLPNGNTPSYRITAIQTEGPVTGPLTPRAFMYLDKNTSADDDNLAAWLYQTPLQPTIPVGTTGRISYRVIATTDPLPLH